VLLVHGPAGVGKRSFLAHAGGELAAGGAHVVNLLGVAEPDLQMLDVNAAAGPRRVLLTEAGCRMDDDLSRRLIGGRWLVVVAGETEREVSADAWRAAGAQVNTWSFPAFGARDWYRWIAASV